MKKFLPALIVILGFSGFLTAQLAWDTFKLNAQQIDQNKSKDALYNGLFQQLSLITVDHQKVEPRSLKTPLVVINFWASWCLPCLKEMPSLVAMEKKYAGKMTVIGVNGDEETPAEHIEKISKKYGLTFAQVPDPKSEISDKFLITSYPFSIIYHKGKVVHVSVKIQDFMDPELISKLDALVSAK